jgi:hypothetical protein
LYVYRTAWLLDRHGAKGARSEIAGIKAATPAVKKVAKSKPGEHGRRSSGRSWPTGCREVVEDISHEGLRSSFSPRLSTTKDKRVGRWAVGEAGTAARRVMPLG